MSAALRVHRRLALDASGARQETRSVVCPRDGATVPMARCSSCQVEEMPAPVLDHTAFACRRPRGHNVRRTTAMDAADARFVTVRPETRAALALTACAETRAPLAVVVDGLGRALGLVDVADLRRARESTCGELCDPFVVALHASVSFGTAATFLRERGVLAVPLIEAGRIVGVFSRRSLRRDRMRRPDILRAS